jgi:hypothetical protein
VSHRISVAVLTFVSRVGYAQVPYRNNRGSFNGFDLVDKTGISSKPASHIDQYQALGVLHGTRFERR